jgi:hypothetical protein
MGKPALELPRKKKEIDSFFAYLRLHTLLHNPNTPFIGLFVQAVSSIVIPSLF